jgi:glutamyl-Q tRNA(Asp) synthetase
MSFITRFAPSPTGFLHLGHAYSAFRVFDAAHAAGGAVLLRIEDIDQTRSRSEFDDAIIENLTWLGFVWDGEVRRQSLHLGDYEGALHRLISQRLVYRCFKTRKEIAALSASAPHGAGEPVVSAPLPAAEEAQKLSSGAAFAWRLSLDRCREWLGARWDALGFEADGAWMKADPTRLGDVVLARKDFPTSYHLASVWDDALQGVTYVIRGDDLRDATHLHVLLQALFAVPTPIYRHHPLILGADGKRLSKRDGAASLRSLRESGFSPNDVRAMLGLP